MASPPWQHVCKLAQLVRQIIDLPEGSPCFLYLTTEGAVCFWDDVGDNIIIEGRNAEIWLDATKDGFMQYLTIATSHCAAHYACYTYTASTWAQGNG